MAAILISLWLAMTPYAGCVDEPCEKDWDCCDGFLCEDSLCKEVGG